MKSSSLLLLFLLMLGCDQPLVASSQPPNIILIFTDDQGYEDLGCFGSQKIKTPHLDRMAAQGLRLTSFYAQPVCGVSRAALMTGSYPIRVGEPGNIKRLHTVPHPKEVTLAETLKSAGYATALIGKWHLTLRDASSPTGYNPETMPNAQGFDFFYGTPLYNGTTVRVQDTPFRSPLLRNNEIVQEKIESWDHITGDYTREALSWIESHRESPFFLYLAHNLPHIPLGASDEFRGRSAYGPYGDAIEEIDASCGRILDKLHELGLEKKTLVIYTSDNGPWVETTAGMKPGGKPFIPRDHSGSAAPLRGWKMSAWEGGSRVPCIAYWPGTIPAGRVSDQIFSTMDLLPTFASLANAALPPVTLDGLNATDFLLGRSETSPRDSYLYYAGTLLTGIRVNQWKLVLPRKAAPTGTGWWGRMLEAVPAIQLYDLNTDPGETQDQAADHPEVVQQLMARIETARKDLGDFKVTGAGARFFDEQPRHLETEPAPPEPDSNIPAEPAGSLRFTFESGTLEGWQVIQGQAGRLLSDLPALPRWKEKPFDKEGRFHLSTIDTGSGVSDKLQVTVASPPFVIQGDRARFLLSGGGHPKLLHLALRDAETGKDLRVQKGPQGPQMRRYEWDVSNLRGKTVQLALVDQSQGAWGHLNLDDFSVEGVLVAQAEAPKTKAEKPAFGQQVSPEGIRHRFLITGSRTAILDEESHVVWEVPGRSRDGQVLASGNILISHHTEVIEYSPSGDKVWNYKLDPANKEMGTAIRLPDGKTLLVERGVKPRLLEITPEGKIALEVPLQPETSNIHMQTRMARKLPNGNYIVPHLLAFAVKEYTPTGKVVRTLRTDLEELGGRAEENWPFTAIQLDGGRFLVNLTHGNKTVELDAQGNVVWRVDNSHVGGRFADPCGGQRLPNGNTVICSYGQKAPDKAKAFEINPEKKVVWEYLNPDLRGIHQIHVITTNGDTIQPVLK